MKMTQTLKDKLRIVSVWTIFPVIAFFGLSFLIQFSMVFVAQFFDKPNKLIASSGFVAIYVILFFGLFSAVMYFLPRLIFKTKLSKSEMGIFKDLTWLDVGLAIAGFVSVMLLSGIVLNALSGIFPGFDINQPQDIGFTGLVRGYEYALAFVCIVIIPAFVEEFVFRGIIYGQLRKVNVVFAIFWTSLLFGLAHRQLNVGIVTFIMSVVMCFIREKFTHTIWSGVIIHFFKNAIAFYVSYFLQIGG